MGHQDHHVLQLGVVVEMEAMVQRQVDQMIRRHAEVSIILFS